MRQLPDIHGGRSALDERAPHLVGNRIEKITHHGPAAGLHENFSGHPRQQLLAVQSPALALGQHDSDGEISRVGLLIVTCICRHVGYSAVELRRRALIEGREADKCILSCADMVDVVRIDPRLNLQIIRIRDNFQNGFACANHSANSVDGKLVDYTGSWGMDFDPVEQIARRNSTLGKFGLLGLGLVKFLYNVGAEILIDAYDLKF